MITVETLRELREECVDRKRMEEARISVIDELIARDVQNAEEIRETETTAPVEDKESAENSFVPYGVVYTDSSES